MGWLDFLTGSKGDQKHIDKVKRRLLDQYRQSEERYEAMDELTALGTPEALDALLERFGLQQLTKMVGGFLSGDRRRAMDMRQIEPPGNVAPPLVARPDAGAGRTATCRYFLRVQLREVCPWHRACGCRTLHADSRTGRWKQPARSCFFPLRSRHRSDGIPAARQIRATGS